MSDRSDPAQVTFPHTGAGRYYALPMKWFTREYVTGGLDDDEWERRRLDYARHLTLIQAKLADGAEELVASVNVHDGQVQEWSFEPDGAFRLRLLAGDLQRGYEMLTLLYHGAELVDATTADLDAWRLDQAGVELVEDEVDVRSGGGYEHRLLVWPEGAFGIRFHALQVTRQPARPEERR